LEVSKLHQALNKASRVPTNLPQKFPMGLLPQAFKN